MLEEEAQSRGRGGRRKFLKPDLGPTLWWPRNHPASV
jgi:hypothetical protein